MKWSIRKKTTLMTVIFALVLDLIATLILSNVISGLVDKRYCDKADNMSATIAQMLDVEPCRQLQEQVSAIYSATDSTERVGSWEWGTSAFYAYLDRYNSVTQSEAFQNVRALLQSVQATSKARSVYLAYVDASTRSFVYLVDSATEDPCQPGCFDPLNDENQAVLSNPTRGFPARITDSDKCGWLVTAGAPLQDADGNVICYVMTDISMESVRAEQNANVIKTVLIMLVATAVLCYVVLVIINNLFVKPLRQIADAASRYRATDASSAFINHNAFSKLDIHTRDEIESLTNSMKQMESDMNEHLENLMSAHDQLSVSKSVASEMSELANTDSLTGLRNKTAYDVAIAELSRDLQSGRNKFGIVMIDLNFLKRTNDTYGHENGNAAITDLGKLICAVYAHSPVFRIGGDEFAVILKHHDFMYAMSLAAEFNARIEHLSNDPSLPPWRQISAALGYALFNPDEDTSVLDVFKRADHAMYDRKREMKSIRTD